MWQSRVKKIPTAPRIAATTQRINASKSRAQKTKIVERPQNASSPTNRKAIAFRVAMASPMATKPTSIAAVRARRNAPMAKNVSKIATAPTALARITFARAMPL